MNPDRSTLCRILLLVALLTCASTFPGGLHATEVAVAGALPAHLGPGMRLEALQVGAVRYTQVKILSVNARTVMIAHSAGMVSLRLRDLAPGLRSAFGYDPAAEQAADAKLAADQPLASETKALAGPSQVSRAPAKPAFERLLQSFGQPPEIKPEVDLRPKFIELSLGVKNQGPRPSCAVFAIVSVLEFQNAQLVENPGQLSEEYLLWATNQTLRRASVPRMDGNADNSESLDTADLGYSLAEVLTALRAYGIPSQSSLPYSFSITNKGTSPPREVIEAARTHNRVSVVSLPGRDRATQIANLIHALDARIPVAVGLAWPPWRALRTAYLSTQKPRDSGGHAVAIVGYENKTGLIQDTVFTFKNSWGAKWGSGGYGYVTYRYLLANLDESAVLEFAPAENK